MIRVHDVIKTVFFGVSSLFLPIRPLLVLLIEPSERVQTKEQGEREKK